MYLTGTTYWIGTEAAAIIHAEKIVTNPMYVIRCDTDKTYTIFYLSVAPLWPNQVEFQLRDGEIVRSSSINGEEIGGKN